MRARPDDLLFFNFGSVVSDTGGGCGSEINRLVDSLRKVRCAQARIIAGHDCADVRSVLVRISLASIPDSQEH
jgi:hypothetical protein